jgi:hypothetical protein
MYSGQICRCSKDDNKSLLGKKVTKGHDGPGVKQKLRELCIHVLLKSVLSRRRGKTEQFLITNN